MSAVRRGGQWVALLVVSAILSVALNRAAVPAAMLLGPMLAGMAFALCGAELATPRLGFAVAQSVVGCLVAMTLTPSTLAALGRDWLAILTVIVLVVAAGGLVGYLLVRSGALPGNTAAWGASPGGAAAMTAMAEAYGADVRLVAFMQYLRVFVVVLTASGVSRLLLGHEMPQTGPVGFSPGFDAPLLPLAQTLALVACGVLAGRWRRIPAGALLAPMLCGAVLGGAGIMTITLPPWLLWCAYALLGWFIGLRFTARTVRHALAAIPRLLAATFTLIALCGATAWLLSAWTGIDALSAYLATTPGGLDSVTVIAVGSGCDVPFVLAVQTLRLFAVVLAGPMVARLVSRLGHGGPSCRDRRIM